MEKRFLFWLLIPLLLVSGCSRKSDSPAGENGGLEAETVVEVEADEGPSIGFESVSLEGVTGGDATVGSGGATNEGSQVTPVNMDEGREVLVQSPRPLVYFSPFYPLSMRMEGIEGQVVLQFILDRSGRVVNPTVSASTVPEFNEYVLQAARDWRFLPALADGKPIDLEVSYPINFVSEKGSLGIVPGSIFSRLDLIFDTYYIDGPEGYELAEMEVTPIYRQVPQRPRDENDEPITGRVMLNFTVTTEGQVTDPKVIESTDTRLEMPAVTAIKYWQFIPRMRAGKPVESRVQQPISFTSGAENGGN